MRVTVTPTPVPKPPPRTVTIELNEREAVTLREALRASPLESGGVYHALVREGF